MSSNIDSIDEQNLKEKAQEAMGIGIEEIEKEYSSFIKPSVEEVRIAALDLLNVATRLKAKSDGVLNQLSHLNYEDENSVLNFSRKMVQNEHDYKELMIKLYDFQDKVNNFLGQQVILTFVYVSPSSGKVDLYLLKETVEAWKADKTSSKRGGDINYRTNQSAIKKMAQKAAAGEKYNENGGKKSLDNAFQEVWQRFRISKSIFKMGGAAYILWKDRSGKNWDGRKVSGAGPLGEAYVAFFMNEYIFPNEIESAVRNFMLNNLFGVVKVDSASGFLQGDVTRGKLELAVKTGRAPAQGYTEIIDYAQKILKEENLEHYLKALKETLREEGKQNAVQNLTSEMRNEVFGSNGFITEMEKRVNLVGKTFNSTGIPVWKKS